MFARRLYYAEPGALYPTFFATALSISSTVSNGVVLPRTSPLAPIAAPGFGVLHFLGKY
jgi:hypothetical protein